VNNVRVNYAVSMNVQGDTWVPSPWYFDTGTDGMFEFCHPFPPHTRVRYSVSKNGIVLGGLEGEFTSNLLVPRIVIEGLP
jgi:hypothetical protein